MTGSPDGIINSDGNEVPENTISIIPFIKDTEEYILPLVESLKGKLKRDWFNSHFYYCLPLTIANQYGYVIYAEDDFSVLWNGGDHVDDLKVFRSDHSHNMQHYSSHFGSGIVTIQNSWTFRTPPGINIMTIDPPNIIKPYISHMAGVVESDNLRRDFTFNLKVTEPNQEIFFKKGEVIGAFMPVPRYFVDSFNIEFAKDIFSVQQINEERQIMEEFGKLRSVDDVDKPHQAGRLYFKGYDAWGNKFPDHQKGML